MKVLIISDSFKGTLTSTEVGTILKETIESYSNIQASYIPISDGGEGFLDVIKYNIDVDEYKLESVDAINNKCISKYLYKEDIAYIELAEIVGIKNLTSAQLDCFHANTYGLGLLIKKVINKHHPKKIVIGLGGSASTDGGSGMLEALGAIFYNNDSIITSLDNEKLSKVTRVDLSEVIELTQNTEFLILTDVLNPLLGSNGAAYIFGKQKGALERDLEVLDRNLKKFVNAINDKTYCNMPGSGAAGGTGFGCLYGLNAKVESGIVYLLKLINFKKVSLDYDYIITGEGKFDHQSKMGKVYQGIYSSLDKKEKLLIICGISNIEEKNIFSVVPKIASIDESIKKPKKYLKKLVEQKLIKWLKGKEKI